LRLIIQEVKPLHADEVESKTKETGARKSKVNGHVRRLATLEPQCVKGGGVRKIFFSEKTKGLF